MTKNILIMVLLAGLSLTTRAHAQSELYPKHFDLEQVTLLDGPMKTAMEKNFETLLAYDADRLLTPYVRQSGLAATTDNASQYYQWETKHPSFPNWGSGKFSNWGWVPFYCEHKILAGLRDAYL